MTNTNYTIHIRYETTNGVMAEMSRDGYGTRESADRAVNYYLRKYDKLNLGAAGKVVN